MRKVNTEIKCVFGAVVLIFGVFLLWPLVMLLGKSFQVDGHIGLEHYASNILNGDFALAFLNSVWISSLSAVITTVLAFFLAYTVHYTALHPLVRKAVGTVTLFPMFLPTITYGFVIIYAFGRQGLITNLFGGWQIMDIYGPCGLMTGYVIYTIPIAFLLFNNTFRYVDKNIVVVSKIMGDSPVRRFFTSAVRPLVGTIGAVFIQSFTLCFTDFGIPASLGGRFDVVAIRLYNEMLGAMPNFGGGATIAIMMLLPSLAGIMLITWLERYNFRYSKISQTVPVKSRWRDGICLTGSSCILIGIIAVFAVMFVVPFVKGWPYDMSPTLDHITRMISSKNLSAIYGNTLLVAVCTALFGTVVAFGSALATARSEMSGRYKTVVNSIAVITNTVPGMVLGLAYLFAFSGSSIQNTILIIVICNIVHYFTTPYLMGKNSLEKLNRTWEQTASLMGDSWLKTMLRVIIPNSMGTIVEIFSYYFINSMITVSAVIFLVGAHTGVLTTHIKSLQHLGRFDEIFAISLLILATNIVALSVPAIWRATHSRKRNAIPKH